MFKIFQKLSYRIYLYTLVMISFSCVTMGKPLPEWIELKPKNTDKVIYFSYGPTNNRESAQKGIYKVISEYFGVQVSSVDKYIREIEFADGETEVSESKNTEIDLTAREKGLDSVEILEVWNDRGERWCILASLDSKAAKRIKEQVEYEIEQERLTSVLNTGENYLTEIKQSINEIKQKKQQLNRLEKKLEQSLGYLNEMSVPEDILEQSRISLDLFEQVENLKHDISDHLNSIKLTYKKSELLLPKVETDEITRLEMGFLLEIGNEILIEADHIGSQMKASEEMLFSIKNQLDTYKMESELVILGDEESQKELLGSNVNSIKEAVLYIIQNRDRAELLLKSSENLYQDLRGVSQNSGLSNREKNSQSKPLMDNIKTNLDEIRTLSEESLSKQNSIEVFYEDVIRSRFLSDKEKREVEIGIERIYDPLSWMGIMQKKHSVIYEEARTIISEFESDELLSRTLKSFSDGLRTSGDSSLDYTIGEFIVEDSGISSPFSDYIRSQLLTSLVQNSGIRLVDYSSVTDFFNSKRENPDKIYEGYKNSPVDAVIYGEYWVKEGSIDLNINVIKIDNKRLIYSERVNIPLNVIPREIALKPINFEDVDRLDSKLDVNLTESELQIWPDRGSGSTYRDGEEMVINLKTPANGYVKIYHISVDGDMTLIFPNKFDTDNRVQRGAHYTLGDRSYPFRFKLGKPYGVESLKVLFSEEQFDDLSGITYNGTFLYEGIQGIRIESQLKDDLKGDRLYATGVYTIIE